MKTKSYDQLVIGILIGTVASVLIDVLLSYAFYSTREKNPPAIVSKHIETDYFLEVSDDSIKVESTYGDVYYGKYSDLDSLINVDNL
jgi:hypothetical protein